MQRRLSNGSFTAEGECNLRMIGAKTNVKRKGDNKLIGIREGERKSRYT